MPGSGGVGEGLLDYTPGLLTRFDAGFGRVAAVTEAIGLVAGLHDVAVMREPVEQCRGHLRIDEDSLPLKSS